MAQFKYQGRDATGAKVEGLLEASSTDAAVAQLFSQRITPLSVQEQVIQEAHKTKFRFPPEKISLDDMVVFCRQMYALTRSGIPLVQAVSGLAEMSRSELMRETLRQVVLRLRAGSDLATSLREHDKIFSHVFVSLVHVGENTGRLDEAFKRLIGHLELERQTKQRVSQALRYPSFVFIAMAVAMGVINLMVIPNFAGVFSKLGADLPLPTRILMATSEFTVNYWQWILLLGVGGFVAFFRWTRTDAGALWWDKYKLRLPLIGHILNKIALSRFTRSFAMMSESGVPVLQALGIVGATLGNRYVEAAIVGMRRNVERGDSLARSAAATQMFTPLILQMITVGEETGSLDKLMNDVSDFYEEEVDQALKRLSDAIEPIVLVFMGVLVVILALGVFLPMWELGSKMR